MLTKRLIVRIALAAAGALTVFTTAVATPAQCRLEIRGRTLIDGPCFAERQSKGGVMFEREDGGTKISVSIFPDSKTNATGLLAIYKGNDSSYDDLGALKREGRCWANTLVKACVTRIGAS